MDPVEHYRYLIEARRKLMESVRHLSPAQYEQEFPFGLNSVRRTLLTTAQDLTAVSPEDALKGRRSG